MFFHDTQRTLSNETLKTAFPSHLSGCSFWILYRNSHNPFFHLSCLTFLVSRFSLDLKHFQQYQSLLVFSALFLEIHNHLVIFRWVIFPFKITTFIFVTIEILDMILVSKIRYNNLPSHLTLMYNNSYLDICILWLYRLRSFIGPIVLI